MKPRTDAPLNLQTLEPRDVPAATILADIRPGQWGSFPRDFTASGEKVYFAATSVQGEELWVTDGTTAGTRLTRDIRPSSSSSNPRLFTPAGNGILYFVADDGGGRAWWKTDGTTTTKVSGLPANIALESNGHAMATGLADGSVLLLSADKAQLWWADGTSVRLLENAAQNTLYFAADGAVSGSTYVRAYDAQLKGYALIRTDGTYSGTQLAVPCTTVGSTGHGLTQLQHQAQMASGNWVGHARYNDGTTELWLAGSFGAIERIHTGPTSGSMWAVAGGSKVLFLVNTSPSQAELWQTDGTAAGTEPVNSLPGAYDQSVASPTLFGDRLIVGFRSPEGQKGLALTNGGETLTLLAPDGSLATGLVGVLPASTRHPTGLMVLKSGSQLFASTGTERFWLDTTGIPAKAFTSYFIDPFTGQGAQYPTNGAMASNGRVYYASPWENNFLPEPAAWDLLAGRIDPPPTSPPTVTAVTVNDGAAQRSMVNKLTIEFDQVVTLDAGAIRVVKDFPLRDVGLNVSTQVVNGRTIATVTFTDWERVGGSLADGTYTLTVTASKVRNATGGTMTADRTQAFHRLFSDLNGDRSFDRAARTQVLAIQGSTRGTANYLAALDFDDNGVIDRGDELQVIRRWGKTV